MPDLNAMAAQAVDLKPVPQDDAKSKADAALQEQQARVDAAQRALAWQRKMNRAFRGIVSRQVREAALQRALVRYNAEVEA